jgi:hypothetical protein
VVLVVGGSVPGWLPWVPCCPLCLPGAADAVLGPGLVWEVLRMDSVGLSQADRPTQSAAAAPNTAAARERR